MRRRFKVIIIGGSAGSLQVITQLLLSLPKDFSTPIIIVIHRLKNVLSEMNKTLSIQTKKNIVEPEDKLKLQDGCIYLAPQNYHLLLETDHTLSLDYSETVQFSRPSIDVTFESASRAFGEEVLAILLSGANKDGANGLSHIIAKGGTGIVQEPSSALYPIMPRSAIEQNKNAIVLTPDKIREYLQSNL